MTTAAVLLSSELLAGLADDAATLAFLHSRELTAEVLDGLAEVGFPANLALAPQGGHAEDAHRLLDEAVRTLAADAADAQLRTDALETLAVDFAAIYLTGSYGASPCESVWVDDDHIVCQEPMFELRKLYAEAGLAAPDWRTRPDDHLVHQLDYVAHRLRSFADLPEAELRAVVAALADVLDIHLLRWLPDFAERVAGRCETPFHAGLALLTDAWCQQLRDLFAVFLDTARPSREAVEERLRPARTATLEAVPIHFVPGDNRPSW